MLPPIDEAVLEKNPDFDKVYKTLTGSLLNPDCSTKSDRTAKKRDAIREELKTHRLKSTKQHLLRRALAASAVPDPEPNTAPTGSKAQQTLQHRRTRSRQSSQATIPTISAAAAPLPPEITDLILLLSSFLSKATDLSPASLALLFSRPPLSALESHFPTLTALVSARLSRQGGTLARTLHPTTNPSYIHRAIPSLASTTTHLYHSLQSHEGALRMSRQHATHILIAHLARHAQALAQLVRTLEAKHGPAARSTCLRAEQAALDARTLAVAAEALLWDARRDVYPPNAQRALHNYRRHLGDARLRLLERARAREAELADYGVDILRRGDGGGDGGGGGSSGKWKGKGEGDPGKERTMREMARVWSEMETRLAEVKGDLERLG
ncbi:hypothetical protein F4779DRAFT_327782 [Xylariaceae sp. FL0662B]|nr:hypothetical protein F4779DRAFT_327782 [Xylariaceae sp. FL0662B]